MKEQCFSNIFSIAQNFRRVKNSTARLCFKTTFAGHPLHSLCNSLQSALAVAQVLLYNAIAPLLDSVVVWQLSFMKEEMGIFYHPRLAKTLQIFVVVKWWLYRYEDTQLDSCKQ